VCCPFQGICVATQQRLAHFIQQLRGLRNEKLCNAPQQLAIAFERIESGIQIRCQ
jgi:hypothetical protein